MEIVCVCGNNIFTKAMKLKMVKGFLVLQQNEIQEEICYICTKCGFTVAKKEIKNFQPIKTFDEKVEIILIRDKE